MVNTNPSTCSFDYYFLSFVINESRTERMMNDSKKKEKRRMEGKLIHQVKQSLEVFDGVNEVAGQILFASFEILRARTSNDRRSMNRFAIVTVYFFPPGFYYFPFT